MSIRVKTLAIAFSALALACGNAEAQRYRGGGGGGYYHGHGGGSGFVWGGIGLGLGLGLGLGSYYRPYDYLPYDYVVVDRPATVYYNVPPVVAPVVSVPPATSGQPDPVFYPRNGQSTAQTEADRQACNRWATTQPSAMADATVFQRATLACMDGRGYSSR